MTIYIWHQNHKQQKENKQVRHQTKAFLSSKGNDQQNKNENYGKGENIWISYMW